MQFTKMEYIWLGEGPFSERGMFENAMYRAGGGCILRTGDVWERNMWFRGFPTSHDVLLWIVYFSVEVMIVLHV